MDLFLVTRTSQLVVVSYGITWECSLQLILATWARTCSIVHAELWGIPHGIKIACMMGFRKVILEADSLVVINLILNGCPPTHPGAPLVGEIQRLSRYCDHVNYVHTWREANSVADILAKHGHSMPLGVHCYSSPPTFISVALLSDFNQTLYERASR